MDDGWKDEKERRRFEVCRSTAKLVDEGNFSAKHNPAFGLNVISSPSAYLTTQMSDDVVL